MKECTHSFYTAFYEKCGYSKKENEMVSVAVGVLVVVNLTLTVSGQVRPRALTFAQTVNPVLFAPCHMDFLHVTLFHFPLAHVHICCVTILDIGVRLCIIYQSSVDIRKVSWFSTEVWPRVALAYKHACVGIVSWKNVRYTNGPIHPSKSAYRPPLPPFICCFETFGAVLTGARVAG